jgi:hypothetical protein
LLGLCGLIVLGVLGPSAAGGAGPEVCSGGAIAAGTHGPVVVTGTCLFSPGTTTIRGNLTIAPGAALNDHIASSFGATVHVSGNVIVGKGGVVGLGDYDPALPHDSAMVDGNVVADQPASLYLGGMTVRGNVVANGGSGPGRNFPLKDDTIGGNVVVQGWSGLWFGVIRTIVGGNVVVSGTSGTQTGEGPFEGIPDSTELVSNTIGGNLVCQGNSPPAQIGDAALEGGGPNTVRGHKIGECAGL